MECSKRKRKSPLRYKYFIIRFSNGEEALVTSNDWYGLTPFTKYLKEEYCDDSVFVAIRWWEAVKFLFRGRVFNANK